MAKKLQAKETVIVLPKLRCKRCGHEWTPREERLPKFCARCNSPYWNRERGSLAVD